MEPSEPATGGPPPPAAPERERGATRAWAYPVMWMVIVLILVVGGVYAFKSCLKLPGETLRETGKLVHEAGSKLASIVAAFKQGSVTTSFTSYATSLSGSQFLQFATLSQTEVFTRKDEASVAWGYVPLPDVIVEAAAPVNYTYYLDLNERWDFVLSNGVIEVTAPDIKFNKPAVDASRITYEVRKGSLIRDTDGALKNLKESITLLSYQKAKANIELVRETGRRQTETFVQNWVTTAFTDGKRYPVRVHFRHEPGGAGPAPTPLLRDLPGK